MDTRQAFKFAVMAALIEQGITEPAAMAARVKAAADAMDKQAGFGDMALGALSTAGSGIWDAASRLGSTAMSWGIPAALAGPPLAGAALGHLAAKATGNIDDYDIDEAKQQEVIDEYHRQAARARRRSMVDKYEVTAGRHARPGGRLTAAA